MVFICLLYYKKNINSVHSTVTADRTREISHTEVIALLVLADSCLKIKTYNDFFSVGKDIIVAREKNGQTGCDLHGQDTDKGRGGDNRPQRPIMAAKGRNPTE